MSDQSLRKVCLHSLLIILLGFIAGVPLLGILQHEVYGQPGVSPIPGDYRAWRMAHLEAILNALLMLGIAFACRSRSLPPQRDKTLAWGLILMGWGNGAGGFAAAALQARGMLPTGLDANTLVMGVFSVGFVGTAIAFWIGITHQLPTSGQT